MVGNGIGVGATNAPCEQIPFGISWSAAWEPQKWPPGRGGKGLPTLSTHRAKGSPPLLLGLRAREAVGTYSHNPSMVGASTHSPWVHSLLAQCARTTPRDFLCFGM